MQRFVDYYGEQGARDIMAYIRMIMMGNLYGNTFDAFLSRFKGKPSADSSLLSELAIFGLTLVGFIPFSLAMAFRMF